MKVRTALVAGGLAATLVVAGCSNENEARKLGSVNPVTTTTAPPGNTSRVGDIVKLGDAEVTVHGFQDPFDPGAQPMPKAPAGFRYVMIDAEVRNRKLTTPVVVSAFSQFELKDSDDEIYTPIVLPGGIPALGGEAQPQTARRGNVAFQVPESAKGLQVIFNNLLYGKGKAAIYLA